MKNKILNVGQVFLRIAQNRSFKRATLRKRPFKISELCLNKLYDLAYFENMNNLKEYKI